MFGRERPSRRSITLLLGMNVEDVVTPSRILCKTIQIRQWRSFAYVVLMIVIFNSGAAGKQGPRSMQEAIQKASVIVTAKVEHLQSMWRGDERGKHIYTDVRLQVTSLLKGEVPQGALSVSILGGSVGDISELVFPSTTFTEGEECLLLLQEGGTDLLDAYHSKIGFSGGKAYCENMIVSVSTLLQSVEQCLRSEISEHSFKELLQRTSDQSAAQSQQGARLRGAMDNTPVITSVTPPKASSGTSTLITIQGKNFLADQGSGSVAFVGGGQLGRFLAHATVWSDTQIVCLVPGTVVQSASSGPLIVTNSSGLASNSFPFRITFGYRQVKWLGNTPQVQYYVNPNYSDSSGLIAAIGRAAATWNTAGSPLTLTYSGTHDATTTGYDGKSEILWGSAPPGALAMATCFTQGTQILEADMIFDKDNLWSAEAGHRAANVFDVESIALHEFGHFLMLADLYGDVGDSIYDHGKVMYGACDSLGATRRILDPDDQAGLQWIYGFPGSRVPAPVITPSQGSYSTSLTVTILCSAPEVTIRYTTDGTEPTSGSTLYYQPIIVKSPVGLTIKAKGFRDGWVASPTVTAQYAPTSTLYRPQFTSKLRDTTIIQNQTLTFAFRATDADNDSLTFSLLNSPGGAVISKSGLLSWTPSSRQSGSFILTALVSDGLLTDTARATVSVTKINLKPVIASRIPATLTQSTINKSITFLVSATDMNGDTLTYAWRVNGASEKAGLDSSFSRVFTGNPGVSQYVLCTVSDPGGLRDSTAWNFTLIADSVAAPPTYWSSQAKTGKNCSIYISGLNMQIGTQSFRYGDAIGVFYKRNDSLICGGYTIWENKNTALTAWGDDDQTTMKDGFSEGETFAFKVWDSRSGKVFNATAQFSQGAPTYATNGLYVLSSLVGSTAVFVEDQNPAIPEGFTLYQNYPNPFNPATSISYAIGDRSFVLLEVFDMLGRRVAVLVDGLVQPGVHTVRWDASSCPSGVYTYRLRAGELVQSMRMTLMK
jgi:hypothetical protein